VQLPESLTGKLWTLDDFEGNSALLVSEFSFPEQMSLISACNLTEEISLFIITRI